MYIFLLAVSISLASCVKIQKKTDLEEAKIEIQTVPVAPAEPVVYTLDETLSLDHNIDIIADQVYLKSKARIYSNQFFLNIRAKEIYTERGAVIQTFPEDSLRASMDTPGKDGGVVHITTQMIQGYLQVFMNGQAGGPGQGGWTAYPAEMFSPPRDPCAPTSGQNAGVSGSFFLETHRAQDFAVTTSMKMGEAGAVGPIWDGSYFTVFNNNELHRYRNFKRDQNCYPKVPPVAGKPGIPGQICIKWSEADRPECEKF